VSALAKLRRRHWVLEDWALEKTWTWMECPGPRAKRMLGKDVQEQQLERLRRGGSQRPYTKIVRNYDNAWQRRAIAWLGKLPRAALATEPGAR